MRRAAEITAEAHQRILVKTAPGMYEYQVQAELEYCFAVNGARSTAYPSIVGGGNNACVLHYIQNDDVLRKDDLVLVDAGGEYESYAADVTRTFPVSGTFSKAQAEIYEVVLDAQLAAIEEVQPGNLWNQPHEAAVARITSGLVQLGLLDGDLEELIEQESYKKYYMHKTGHWLGLDVHDVGEYQIGGAWRVFEPGMVTTIEPGPRRPALSAGGPATGRPVQWRRWRPRRRARSRPTGKKPPSWCPECQEPSSSRRSAPR